MLRVDLGTLQDGPISVVRSIPPGDELLAGLEFRLVQDLEIDGELKEAGPDRYFWSTHMKTAVRAMCRRCLTPVTIPLDLSLNLVFVGGEAPPPDPSVYSVGSGVAVLDLGEAVREELILAVPEYTVCSENCSGLCSGCGVNLNSEQCRCEPATDPRWAPLDQLRAAENEN